MKPTEAQKLSLQTYLHDTLSYRETYEEIYDHILSAMEFQPEGVSFEDAINNIIRNDFGGAKNLVKIETESKNAMVKEGLNKFLRFVTQYFKLPLLLYTVLATVQTYYFLSKINPGAIAIEAILVLLTMLVPCAIHLLRLYNTGYLLSTTRKSARDKMFDNLAAGPIRLLLLLNVWIANTSTFNEWFGSHPYIITMVLLVCTVYDLALYQLYTDEFKTVTEHKRV
ncbi:hypothetical protein [Mucilaginibacter pedocola]|uniref:Uncharacterized protein n=1 Tax=Mucilaginibacter pedocola TaxID=1792845 RepID=A0A1S9P656_9SPHI|nr:hypothetical protein [Mucilaginibacter pedocola]OOQ56429.1 hypothetical protein BC343_18435 [Mucilaginibacter pedocola]